MNLRGCDLLQQWKTQINIPPVSETNHKLMYAFEKNIKRYCQEQSLIIQVVYKQGTTTADLLKVPTVLPLKWLTEKLVWVKQWPLTADKLQALEQLLPEKLDGQHIEE